MSSSTTATTARILQEGDGSPPIPHPTHPLINPRPTTTPTPTRIPTISLPPSSPRRSRTPISRTRTSRSRFTPTPFTKANTIGTIMTITAAMTIKTITSAKTIKTIIAAVTLNPEIIALVNTAATRSTAYGKEEDHGTTPHPLRGAPGWP